MCKTEVADSAFADCRRLSDIEYGQWDFSDTEDMDRLQLTGQIF